MTVQTTQPEQVPGSWSNEPDINLRQYLHVLVQWRREIGLLTLLAAGLAAAVVLLFQWMRTPLYKASAEVAIVRTLSDVQFDERFRTQPLDASRDNVYARRLALVSLANSPLIAQEVIDELGPQLSDREREPDTLLTQVMAEFATPVGIRAVDSDLIRIEVRAHTPEKASVIANAWATAYVRRANAVFGQVPEELFSSVASELHRAEVEYAQAQQALEDFYANSRNDELHRLILDRQAQIEAITKVDTMNRVAAFEAEQERRRDLVSAYVQAVDGVRLTLLEQQLQRDEEELRLAYSTWISSTLALENARSLRKQVEAGGDSAVRSSALALQLLKLNVYGGLSEQVQIHLANSSAPTVTAEQMLADVDALITSLEARQAAFQQQVEQLANTMLSGEHYVGLGEMVPVTSSVAQSFQQELAALYRQSAFSLESSDLAAALEPATELPANTTAAWVAQLQAEVRQLKSELEADIARQRELSELRDLHWETLMTLHNKMAELDLLRAAANSEVRLAAFAVAPSNPIPSLNLFSTVGLAGFAGLTLAILLAFLAHYMGQTPFLVRRHAAV